MSAETGTVSASGMLCMRISTLAVMPGLSSGAGSGMRSSTS